MRILAGAILVLAAAIVMAGSLVATGMQRNYPTEVTWGYFSAFVVGAIGLFLVVREMRSDDDRRL
jgi:drug/metabolite transporter (DMT)-like permease